MSPRKWPLDPLPDYIAQFLRGLFQNPIKALANGEILGKIIVALILGIALVFGGERYHSIRLLIGELQEFCRIVGWIMLLAPFGIAALLLQLVAGQQSELLLSLGHFIAVVTGTTLFHGLIVLPAILWLSARMSPQRFFKGSREALITAFAILLPIDRVLDTVRTAVTVEGDLVGAVFVQKLAGGGETPTS